MGTFSRFGFILLMAVIVLNFGGSSIAKSATVSVIGGQLVGAHGVDLDGTLYDVMFQEGTCREIFNDCNGNDDFVFQTSGDAFVAEDALATQIFLDTSEGNFDSQPALTFGCNDPVSCSVLIPYNIGFGGAAVAYIGFSNSASTDGDGPQSGLLSVAFDSSTADREVFAKFSIASVPLPAPFSLLLTALAGLGLFRCRKWSARTV